jgi:hypothetical protein
MKSLRLKRKICWTKCRKELVVGDTLILSWIYFDWVYDSDTYAGEMKFVLE